MFSSWCVSIPTCRKSIQYSASGIPSLTQCHSFLSFLLFANYISFILISILCILAHFSYHFSSSLAISLPFTNTDIARGYRFVPSMCYPFSSGSIPVFSLGPTVSISMFVHTSTIQNYVAYLTIHSSVICVYSHGFKTYTSTDFAVLFPDLSYQYCLSPTVEYHALFKAIEHIHYSSFIIFLFSLILCVFVLFYCPFLVHIP